MDSKFNPSNRQYRTYLLLLLVFVWGLVLAFVMVQYHKESEFKKALLDSSLQQVNISVVNGLLTGDNYTKLYKRACQHFPNIRLTLIDLWGNVIYDSSLGYRPHVANHSSRPEVREALENGHGYTVRRLSESAHHYYFYSALRSDAFIVRTCLPYTTHLNYSLRVSNSFIWFLICITILFSSWAYMFLRRMQRTEIALKQEQERVLYEEQQKVRIKKQLTSSINHEIKTPVSAICGILETLVHNPQMEAPLRHRFLSQGYHQAERLAKLLGDISTINKMDEGVDLLRKERVSITALLQEVLEEVHEDMPQLPLTIELKHFDGQALEMVGNAALLRSIFRNLIDNAIAYSGGKTMVIEHLKDIEMDYERYYQFVCYDDGNGVPEAHLPFLFERFYRVDKGRSRQLGGTGLGLSIVKNAIQLHEGSIEVFNRERGGLAFHFTLKVKP